MQNRVAVGNATCKGVCGRRGRARTVVLGEERSRGGVVAGAEHAEAVFKPWEDLPPCVASQGAGRKTAALPGAN
jgi:hypothetical protein